MYPEFYFFASQNITVLSVRSSFFYFVTRFVDGNFTDPQRRVLPANAWSWGRRWNLAHPGSSAGTAALPACPHQRCRRLPFSPGACCLTASATTARRRRASARRSSSQRAGAPGATRPPWRCSSRTRAPSWSRSAPASEPASRGCSSAATARRQMALRRRSPRRPRPKNAPQCKSLDFVLLNRACMLIFTLDRRYCAIKQCNAMPWLWRHLAALSRTANSLHVIDPSLRASAARCRQCPGFGIPSFPQRSILNCYSYKKILFSKIQCPFIALRYFVHLERKYV